MEPSFLKALSRATARTVAWRFTKPIVRAAVVAAGLAVLALVGRSAVAGAGGASATPPAASSPPSGSGPPPAAGVSGSPERIAAAAPVAPQPTEGTPLPRPPADAASAEVLSRVRATPDNPVSLNTATESDLRRLPGIGAKRATAILALRLRLGRFRAVEDLLKVKGIGRSTLKRLRPLLRLDAPDPPH